MLLQMQTAFHLHAHHLLLSGQTGEMAQMDPARGALWTSAFMSVTRVPSPLAHMSVVHMEASKVARASQSSAQTGSRLKIPTEVLTIHVTVEQKTNASTRATMVFLQTVHTSVVLTMHSQVASASGLTVALRLLDSMHAQQHHVTSLPRVWRRAEKAIEAAQNSQSSTLAVTTACGKARLSALSRNVLPALPLSILRLHALDRPDQCVILHVNRATVSADSTSVHQVGALKEARACRTCALQH